MSNMCATMFTVFFMQAFDANERLTPLGQHLANLPVCRIIRIVYTIVMVVRGIISVMSTAISV